VVLFIHRLWGDNDVMVEVQRVALFYASIVFLWYTHNSALHNTVLKLVKLGVNINLYVANLDSGNISIIDKKSFNMREIKAGEKPLRLCRCEDKIYVINHMGNSLQEVEEGGRVYRIPFEGLPDNLFVWEEKPVITSHSGKELFVVQFDPEKERFALLHRMEYPYGDTRFDTRNVSFYLRGQFGDALFSITNGKTDKDGRLWVTDFLSGKLFILDDD